jgi:hypothetical protein
VQTARPKAISKLGSGVFYGSCAVAKHILTYFLRLLLIILDRTLMPFMI